ncbi:MAG: 16S rRNA (adenine(1518)-N(6)/adenine(1519)-N(6))-dimethyltransferase RsmA [Elusimicrobia bacterium]|nr:16S rRNA (adenine(1518)-N(6)/adenine(1519)-N(6))-dimethyltransferase RsmA [Elusimicrobiota bacterium]
MKTRLGQNFLVDKNITRKIAASADILPSDTIIEIGPGNGILTEEIGNISKKVIAIEIDKTLTNNLSVKFENNNNIIIINKDFLRWTPPRIKKLKFVANLPYYISSAIIGKILHLDNWDTAVLMVQKEVAERLKALPGTDDYGILSIACQVFCTVEKIFDVSNTCFFPKPKVTSTVVKLKRLSKPLIKKTNEKRFFKIVKSAFAHRRKTILNSLSMELDINKTIIQKKLLEANISPFCRAETVSIASFIKLTNVLSIPKK